MPMPEHGQVIAAIYARQSKGNTRSTDEQRNAGQARCETEGWLPRFYEDGVSASRYSTAKRDDWRRLLDDLKAGALSILWLWESSRGDRRAEEWLGLLTRCRDLGVRIYVETHHRLYDVSVPRDWRTLAEEGIDAEYEVSKSSLRILRDVADAAQKGLPHGRIPLGFERVYDPVTRKLVEQRPSEEAWIPRLIINDLARGVPLIQVCRELEARTGRTWNRNVVRKIAKNRAYIGLRTHNGVEYPAVWPALVDELTWYACQRVLSDPQRKAGAKPGRAQHLLSYIALCDVCDGPMQARTNKSGRAYSCSGRGCTSIMADELDEYVSELVIARLSRPDAYSSLRQDDDAAVLAARAETEQLRVRLDEAADAAASGTISFEALSRIEAKLRPDLEAAQRRVERMGAPPALRTLLGAQGDVRGRWEHMPLAAQRDVVKALMDIRVRRQNGKPAGVRSAIDADRLIITPK
jgi:site-specific DNA recombinase